MEKNLFVIKNFLENQNLHGKIKRNFSLFFNINNRALSTSCVYNNDDVITKKYFDINIFDTIGNFIFIFL